MVLALGPLAGGITTVLGLGGGLMLVLVLQVIHGDPVVAMAIASPALMIGNAHRAWLFRRYLPLDAPTTRPWLIAVGIGAIIGGLGAVGLPPIVLKVGMALAAGVAVLRQFGWLTSVPRPRFVAIAGLVVGLASTTGGAGLLAAPLLLSLGYEGHRYLALLSVSALVMHGGRILSFGALGAITMDHLVLACGLAIGIAVGNTVGRSIRERLSATVLSRLQSVTMMVMVALALGGLR
ncbi:MAG: TSUP family transporter [Myxococcota bacterium]